MTKIVRAVSWGISLSAAAMCAHLAAAGQAPATSRTKPELRRELMQLAEEDQAAREGLDSAMRRNDTGYAQRMADGEAARTRRLQAIVAAEGWPSVAQVGRDGVHAAWLLLQHSPDTAWQADMLPVLERAVNAGDVAQGDVALLTDRVLVRSGKPQRYGSSFSILDGRLIADAMEDEEHVDVRRAAVGLPSMAEYVKALNQLYNMPVEWPRK